MYPMGDFKGTTLDYYSGLNYGLSNGFNLHGKAKVGLSGFNLVSSLNYSSLSNSGYSEPGQGKVDITQNVLSLNVGPEFRFHLPALPVIPYIGVHLALNQFNGETTFQGVSKIPSATYSVTGTSRLGVGISAGTEVTIAPLVSLDVALSYNAMNISGKEWIDVNPAVNQRIDSYLSLNDDADPLYNSGDDKHFLSQDRSIGSMLLTVSILFGL